jgi:AcrR family transcriptional regulator
MRMESDDIVAVGRPARRGKASSSRKPRRQTERREGAMAQILDAAEKLFAQQGRESVTIRAVAIGADVDPALVHYYFEDIDGLFHAVFQRKSVIINAIRNKAMDEYLAEHGDELTVEGVFDAFLRPVFQTIAENPKYWANYAAIVSYTVSLRRDYSSSSRFGGRELMREAFDVAVQRFVDMLKKLAPDAPAEEIYWFYHHVAGSLALALAQTGRIDSLSGGLCKSSDMLAVLDSMVRVFSAGFEAVKARSSAARARTARSAAAKRRRPRSRSG